MFLIEERKKKYSGRFVDKLIESIKPTVIEKTERTKIYDKNIKINEDIDNMIDDIDKLLDE